MADFDEGQDLKQDDHLDDAGDDNNNSISNKRTKIDQPNMIDFRQSYLSQTAEIMKFPTPMNATPIKFSFHDIDVTLKITHESREFLIFTFSLRQHRKNSDLNQIYNITMEKYAVGNKQVQIRANNKDHQQFRDVYIEEMNHLQLHFWRQDDPLEEQKCVEFTDCVIHTTKQSPHDVVCNYRANISQLVKSSPVIYDWIKNSKQLYGPDQPMNLSVLFKDVHQKYVHIYLCCVYNPNFKFICLTDIICILKVAVKLDNQKLIQKILNMEDLGNIFKRQVVFRRINGNTQNNNNNNSDNSGEEQCQELQQYVYDLERKIEYILEFAIQCRFFNLILLCTLQIQDNNFESLPKNMKKIVETYRSI